MLDCMQPASLPVVDLPVWRCISRPTKSMGLRVWYRADAHRRPPQATADAAATADAVGCRLDDEQNGPARRFPTPGTRRGISRWSDRSADRLAWGRQSGWPLSCEMEWGVCRFNLAISKAKVGGAAPAVHSRDEPPNQ